MQDSQGQWLSHAEVDKLAAIKNIHIRTGGLCNPGGIATHLQLASWEMLENFSTGFRCGSENDVRNGKPTGVIRVSIGAMNTHADVTRFVSFVQEFFVDKTVPVQRSESPIEGYKLSQAVHYIESLTVYPVKSCAGWMIPLGTYWDVNSTGLAWDREWCVINRSTGAVISQKKHPRMALLRPELDFKAGVLRVIDTNTMRQISVPLSKEPGLFIDEAQRVRDVTVCDDAIQARQYLSSTIAEFFADMLGIPCTLARFTASAGSSSRHMKAHLQRSGGKDEKPSSLLLSNESPILTISCSSLNALNVMIAAKGGKIARAAVFRAKRVGGQGGPQFDFLGGCRRCQMLCIDQETGEKNQEPFVTLAKTRRRDGKVMFGIHTALRLPAKQNVNNAKTIRVGDVVETWVKQSV
jgi:molybdenum cofactor sulfurtransferase